MTKITLNHVADLTSPTTAATTINGDLDTIVTAFDNTLSRDGTTPNTMGSNLDMNSYNIVNLPAPATANSPLRLADATSLTNTGTVVLLPPGGTTGQGLHKTSNTDYAVGWSTELTSVGLALPADFTVTNSPVTTTGTLTGAWATTPTGTGAMVKATSPTLVTPALGTPTAAVLTNATGLPITTGVSGLGTGVSTFLATPTSANLSTAVTDETGTGALVFANTPTLVTPVLGAATGTSVNLSSGVVGVTTNSSAGAGFVGEYIFSQVLAGSAVPITTGTAANVTSISLTAGDWNVWGNVVFQPAATTTQSANIAWISTTSATIPTLPNNGAYTQQSVAVAANQTMVLSAGMTRLSLAGTTTVYLSGLANFATSTEGIYGFIGARRIR